MPASINLLWEALHNNDTEIAPHLLGDVLRQASFHKDPSSVRVHAYCAGCATALAARWPLPVASSFAASALLAADDDGLQAGALLFSGRVLVARGDFDLAFRLIEDALWLTPPGSRESSRLRGSLLLLLAVLMERSHHSDRWEDEIDRAYNLADQLDPDDPDPWHTEFSTANVAVHQIHLLVRRGRVQEAQAVWDATDFSGLSDERRSSLAEATAHFQASLAHVAELMENLTLALGELVDMVPYVPTEFREELGYDGVIAHLKITVSKFEELYVADREEGVD